MVHARSSEHRIADAGEQRRADREADALPVCNAPPAEPATLTLLAAGRPHCVLPLSGVTHVTPQEGVAENLLRLQVRFLKNALDVASCRGWNDLVGWPLVASGAFRR